MKFRGYKVFYVQNFTDVDDKIIKKANELGKTAHEVSENAIREYFTDADGLNVRRADVHPKVTENMDIIIDIVKTLIEKGFAYEADGDVYFETSKFPEYGKLSHMPLEDLQAGARIEVGEKKRDPMDFAVWKAAKPGEPYWDSPFGKGRPGWHIECSAMSRHYIGDTIDIHGGGADLIFPHHENEIAQSECATGQPLANIWMHNGMLNVDGAKMSKSKGNFFMVRDLSKEYGYEPIRFMLLSVHYRSQLNYTLDVIESCKAALQRLYTCRDTLNRAIARGVGGDDDANMETIIYEGYGPGGTAIMIECLSDNRNRTVAEVRHAFSKCGGNLGTDGSVAYLFSKKGVISFEKGDEDTIMEAALEAGAEDVVTYDDGAIDVYTAWEEMGKVRDALEAAGLKADSAEVSMIPSTKADMDAETAPKLMRLIDMLEDCDDVQEVYHNGEISDEVAATL